ncbi:PepSY domain-containing protein [Streptosporangium sp. CA-135522]|uniref:PepSY domain-containing protein n=1 Tax=Streptosporangium sp. CA-135522 TaxID=3240072 RepID=UPI003D906C8C
MIERVWTVLPALWACLYRVPGSVISMNGGKQTKAIIGTIFAGSTLLAAAACGSTHTQSGAVKVAPAGGAVAGLMSPSGPPGGPGQEPGGMASLEKAVTAATKAVKGSTLLSLQSENHGKFWEVQLAGPGGTEQLLEVDASGNVVSEPRVKDTREEEKARVAAMVKDAKLGFRDAVEKIFSAVPQSKITHLSLDRYSDNLLVWDADVLAPDGTWYEIKVDAKDGSVTKNS